MLFVPERYAKSLFCSVPITGNVLFGHDVIIFNLPFY